jgi:hypothetical protein
MRLARWVLAAGIALTPGLVVMEAGCVAARAASQQRFAGPAPPPGVGSPEPDDPGDPCADPDMLDGLDDPCYVDVPPEEVRSVIAAGRSGRNRGPDGKAQE